MTIQEVRRGLRKALTPKYGEREAAAMARMVVMHLKGWSQPEMMANEGREAGDSFIALCRDIQKKLLDNMPIQYALGESHFYGLKLKVGPGVLIPRPETEELVDLIVKENKTPDLSVLDLCTGSGAIALALSRNLPFATVEAVDISPRAISIARENAAALNAKVIFRQEDVLEANPMAYTQPIYDIIVSNPPYVDESEAASMHPNVLDYEPRIAIFVPDDDPLVFYRSIAAIACRSLKEGGALYLEINPRHAAELKRLLESRGFEDITVIRDVHGSERFVKATRP